MSKNADSKRLMSSCTNKIAAVTFFMSETTYAYN